MGEQEEEPTKGLAIYVHAGYMYMGIVHRSYCNNMRTIDSHKIMKNSEDLSV